MSLTRIYSLCSPSHQEMKDRYFLPSIQDDFEITIDTFDQISSSGIYKQSGWSEVMIRKVDLILKAIADNWGSAFLYSDVDVQFFRPVKEPLLTSLENADIVFQQDHPIGKVCAGFFACKGNARTRLLWEEVRTLMFQNPGWDDQDALNELLIFKPWRKQAKFRLIEFLGLVKPDLLNPKKCKDLERPFGVVWDYLPAQFFGGGSQSGKVWEKGQPLDCPENLYMHHANYTIGFSNKIAQLSMIREKQCS